MAKFVLLFDKVSFDAFRAGSPPKTPFSHDQNLTHLGQAALIEGHQVYLSQISSDSDPFCLEVHGFFPVVSMSGQNVSYSDIKPDFVATVHGHLLSNPVYRGSRKIAVHPALYYIEMPHTYLSEQTASLFLALYYNTDFITVQNERMKDIVSGIYSWLGVWSARGRILVCPLGIHPHEAIGRSDRELARADLNLSFDDLVIVNAGGTWSWTDFDTFLLGFIKAVRAGAGRLKLLLSGLKQPENTDHSAFVAKIENILKANSDLLATEETLKNRSWSIRLSADWRTGTIELPTLLSAADFGVNVSKDSLENWQSHRVRILDYLKYELPVITSAGDSFADEWGRAAAVVVRERTVDNYCEALLKLHENLGAVDELRRSAIELKKIVCSDHRVREVIQLMVESQDEVFPRSTRSALQLARGLAADRLSHILDMAPYLQYDARNLVFPSVHRQEPDPEGNAYDNDTGAGNFVLKLQGRDRRLRTAVGVRSDAGIVLSPGKPGHGLYGPYVTLPDGSFKARVYFRAVTRGNGTLEIVANHGRSLIAEKKLKGGAVRIAEIDFACRLVTEAVEVRLTCEEDFEGEIEQVEIRQTGSAARQSGLSFPGRAVLRKLGGRISAKRKGMSTLVK